MTEFLRLLKPQDALAKLINHLPPPDPGTEWINSTEALNRITASAVIAPESLPAFARSTVDGFAVHASDTFGASESLPAYLTLAVEVPMGDQPAFTLQKGQAALIHTGGMLPEGSNGVVMLEYTQHARTKEIEILRAVGPGENILKAGEDIQCGQEVLSKGVKLRPAEIGGLIALGLTKVEVVRLPLVGIISSGDEVIPPDAAPRPGQVRDINSYSLSVLIEQYGGKSLRYGISQDKQDNFEKMVKTALDECDLVIITAGSSASTRDLTAEVIQKMGMPGVLVHGVNVKPGKPTILGVCNGKPVIGLPGNPVSALVIASLFVIPVLDYLNGKTEIDPKPQVTAELTLNIPSSAGREDWVPVRLTIRQDGLYLADPVFYKSNFIFTLARADGLAYIPASATGLSAGETVLVYLI